MKKIVTSTCCTFHSRTEVCKIKKLNQLNNRNLPALISPYTRVAGTFSPSSGGFNRLFAHLFSQIVSKDTVDL